MPPRADRCTQWARRWRELLREPVEDTDWREDFTLHFALGDGRRRRLALLGVMPRADRLIPRVDEIVRVEARRKKTLPDRRLLDLARRGADRIHAIAKIDGYRRRGRTLPVRVVRGDEDERVDHAMDRDGAIDPLFDRVSSAPRTAEDRDAVDFLHEPIYQLSSMAEPTAWALWPYLAGRWGRACALDPIFELWRHGAQVFVDDDELTVFALE